jgi:transcriptional regulator with XRE-family HTH domain
MSLIVLADRALSGRMVSGQELGRRLRAARELAGLHSAEELGKVINERGLSGRTIRNIEAGIRTAQRRDLRAIAEACGLPMAWFEVDIAAAVAAATPSPSEAEKKLQQLLLEEARRTRGPDTTSPEASPDAGSRETHG